MATIPDTLGPLLVDLLDCSQNAMNDAGTPVGRAYVVAGREPVWDNCCPSEPGLPGGTLWVRVIDTYPTAGRGTPFPQRDTSPSSCHPNAWTVQLAVGVVRCTPTQDEFGNPPDSLDVTMSALEMTRDRATLETAVRCCFTSPEGAPDGLVEGKVILYGWEPRGGDAQGGGCAGGEWTLYVGLGSCGCPVDPPTRSPQGA